MGLRDIESTLPPGFRFCPSDEELVFHYLYKKVTNSEKVTDATLMVLNLHTCDPSELPDEAKLNENEWYFFSFRERKYSTGFRTNRAAKKGYWKATGKDRTVQAPSRRPLVGMRKTLVFYNGRAPNGVKSGWVMHEFRLDNPYEPPKLASCRSHAYASMHPSTSYKKTTIPGRPPFILAGEFTCHTLIINKMIFHMICTCLRRPLRRREERRPCTP